jgi:transposase InsO family protein
VLGLIRQVRNTDPARWARVRLAIKGLKTVNLVDLEKLTRDSAVDGTEADAEMFPPVTPWLGPVSGAELLDDLAAIISRHVIADPPTIHAAALWATFTWFIDVVNVAPIANVTAPEKRCGKTVFLGVLARLSCRPLAASNIAPASLFRALQAWQPTLFLDEVDAFLSAHEEARGLLNAGFTRDTAYVIRCVGDDHTPTRFNVWGAKALCGIGKIADTLADRSIPLRLRRKLTGERTVKLRHADPETFAELVSKLARFAIDNREALRTARPFEVEGLNDRANDCWEPLFAVAEVAGGDWPSIARSAAVALHGVEEEAPSIGTELLASIQDAFDTKRSATLATATLLEALAEDEEAPWAAWNRGKPMTAHQLAKRLSEFGIKPTTIRIGLRTPKGYRREQFEEAFRRYLSAGAPQTSATPQQPSSNATYKDVGPQLVPP